MNRKFLKITACLAFTALFFLSSCQDSIFEEIRKEVELEDAQISGSVNSIVRFGSDLYLQNGNIWKKESASIDTAHNWNQITKPTSSADYNYVNKLAADSSYIYAQLSLVDEDEDEGENTPAGSEIYYSSDGESWEGPIVFTDSEGSEITNVTNGYAVLFCTNSPMESHRYAYVRFYDSTDSSYTVYQLNGSSVTALSTISSSDYSSSDNGTTSPCYNTKACTYFNGQVYFTSGNAMETNENPSAEATYIYYTYSDNVYYSADGSTWNSVDLDCSTIYSLGLTADYLMAGTADGIEHTALTDGVPDSGTDSFDTNADSTLSSYYEIRCLLVVDSSLEEQGGTIYGTTEYSGSSSSTSATQENTGLWAYFASRDSWNRE